MINVVLFEPEIPHNTGNIMRTCAATKTKLHLIEPLGFSLDEKNIKRCSTGYGAFSDYQIYKNYEDFVRQNKGIYIFLTRYGKKSHDKFNYKKMVDSNQNIYFVFGKESTGIPLEILKGNLENCTRVPMAEEVRSLNISNTVAIVIYEALRQLDYPNLSFTEVQKGEDYLALESEGIDEL